VYDSRDRAVGGGAGSLLAQALTYAVGNVAVVTPDLLARPTPCLGWDLRMLLRHGCESLAALTEGVASGCVGLAAADESADAAEPAELFIDRARSLLGCRAAGSDWPAIAVGNLTLATDVLMAAGALEIAVHGWDVAQASGSRLPIPSALASELLDVAPLLVTTADRAPMFAAPLFAAPLFAAPLFAPPVAVSREASASDKLTAFLGRPGHDGLGRT
jgi:uncharacterized protein (TIGR03086 family)